MFQFNSLIFLSYWCSKLSTYSIYGQSSMVKSSWAIWESLLVPGMTDHAPSDCSHCNSSIIPCNYSICPCYQRSFEILCNLLYRMVGNSWYKSNQGDSMVQNKIKIKNNEIAWEASFSKKMKLKISRVSRAFIIKINNWYYGFHYILLFWLFLYKIYVVLFTVHYCSQLIS